MAFEDQIELRVIKVENKVKDLEAKPIVIDYGSQIAGLHQDILRLKETLKAHQVALESHGQQLLALSKPKPFYKLWQNKYKEPLWQNIGSRKQ